LLFAKVGSLFPDSMGEYHTEGIKSSILTGSTDTNSNQCKTNVNAWKIISILKLKLPI
jgi:hypothetical protein